MNSVLVGGKRIVSQLLESCPERLLCIQGIDSPELQALLYDKAEKRGIRVVLCRRGQLDRQLSDVNHQGVVAMLEPKAEKGEKELRQHLRQLPSSSVWLVLDRVQDPRNLGAILRSAEATGVAGVVASSRHTAPMSAVVWKTACGAAGLLPVYRVNALSRSLRAMKAAGIWVYGLSEKAQKSCYSAEFCSTHVGLIMGSEHRGIRYQQKQLCDELLSLPMYGTLATLNVSAAAAATLYEVVRQRRLGV